MPQESGSIFATGWSHRSSLRFGIMSDRNEAIAIPRRVPLVLLLAGIVGEADASRVLMPTRIRQEFHLGGGKKRVDQVSRRSTLEILSRLESLEIHVLLRWLFYFCCTMHRTEAVCFCFIEMRKL